MPEHTVLCLNPDGRRLLNHESALRKNGFRVISFLTPIEARFEIEMGRCRVFLTSYITPIPIYHDLASLFRRNCSGGLVVFVKRQPRDQASGADVILSDADAPDVIVGLIRAQQATKASS